MFRKISLLIAILMLGVSAAAVAQTCRDNIPISTPDSQFTDNGNGTVSDAATGLMWKQCAEGLSGVGCNGITAISFTWELALLWAQITVFAGYSDWRLPNKNELESLVERRCYDPAINIDSFPNTPPSWFWSSSTHAFFPGYGAWSVGFDYGHVIAEDLTTTKFVRLVRGGLSSGSGPGWGEVVP